MLMYVDEVPLLLLKEKEIEDEVPGEGVGGRGRIDLLSLLPPI
jgi:hypothetical protein